MGEPVVAGDPESPAYRVIDLGELGFIPDVDVHGTFGISENGIVAFGKVPAGGGGNITAHAWLPEDMFNLSEGIHDLNQVVTLDSPSIARDVNTSGILTLQTDAIRDDSVDTGDVPTSARAVVIDLSQSPPRVVTFNAPDSGAWSSGQAITETLGGDTVIVGNLLRENQCVCLCADSEQGNECFGPTIRAFRAPLPSTGSVVNIDLADVAAPLTNSATGDPDAIARAFDVARVDGSVEPVGYSGGDVPENVSCLDGADSCPNVVCPDFVEHCDDDATTWRNPPSAVLLDDGSGDATDKSRAYGMNAAGDVVGALIDLPYALAWPGGDPNGVVQLDGLTSLNSARALAINDASPTQVVGDDIAIGAALRWEGTLGGSMQVSDLNGLIHTRYTNGGDDDIGLEVAHDINDAGWIVVVSDNDPPAGDFHAAVLVPSEDVLDACPQDIDNDGDVDVTDLLALLEAWGPCPIGSLCVIDSDGDGQVGVSDLLSLLGAWGDCLNDPEPIPQTVQDCLDRFELGTLELEKCIEAVESQQ